MTASPTLLLRAARRSRHAAAAPVEEQESLSQRVPRENVQPACALEAGARAENHRTPIGSLDDPRIAAWIEGSNAYIADTKRPQHCFHVWRVGHVRTLRPERAVPRCHVCLPAQFGKGGVYEASDQPSNAGFRTRLPDLWQHLARRLIVAMAPRLRSVSPASHVLRQVGCRSLQSCPP